jgi:hypothetical protein
MDFFFATKEWFDSSKRTHLVQILNVKYKPLFEGFLGGMGERY